MFNSHKLAMDLERLSGLKVEELKIFLRLRGLKTTGKKQELVARAFVASENNVQIVMTAEQIQEEINKSYMDKLSVVDGVEIPDPFSLTEGWLDEENGVRYWPMTLYPEIFNFLAFHPSELASKDLSDYKTSKAYGYYACGWLTPLYLHNINSDSRYCIIKGSCRPSQRINDNPHKLWICIHKETGKIMCSHCTCMAGMSQTCNHVAAALFRIEGANRIGLNNPSCTSQACAWLPSNKNVKPMKVKSMKLSRSDFGKRGKAAKPDLNSSPKKTFQTVNTDTHKLTLGDIAKALKSVCTDEDNMVFTAFPKEYVRRKKALPQMPSSLDDYVLMSSNAQEFLDNINQYSEEDLAAIEYGTRGQSDSPDWYMFRKHVITASKAHNVKTKMVTLRRNGIDKVNLNPILQSVAGDQKLNEDLAPLRYGRAMESEAVEAFSAIYCQKHKNVQISTSGLYMNKSIPYIAGSPDRIVSCDCCGKFCLEVKCPSSINHTSPMDPNIKLPYLKQENGKVSLNPSHSYYTQCQVQMASSGINQAYFFVWTAHGSFMEKVEFNNDFWVHLKIYLEDFYKNYYIPFLNLH